MSRRKFTIGRVLLQGTVHPIMGSLLREPLHCAVWTPPIRSTQPVGSELHHFCIKALVYFELCYDNQKCLAISKYSCMQLH